MVLELPVGFDPQAARPPKSCRVMMLATVAVTVVSHDLAKGVLVGVLLSGFFFTHKLGRILRVG